MNSPSFRLRRATPADADILARLGPDTFQEAFGDEFPAAVIAARMNAVYDPGRLAQDLADAAQAWFLAEAGDAAIGFLALRNGPAPVPVAGERPVELARVYVRAAWHGRGPGFALMEAGIAEAGQRRADVLWLQAWERNAKALAFYRAHGFLRAGTVAVTFAGRSLPHLVLSRRLST